MPDALWGHLSEFARTRRGVEAWVEQPTSFNPPSILLVAADGESTRRGLPSAAVGYSFAAEHDMPCQHQQDGEGGEAGHQKFDCIIDRAVAQMVQEFFHDRLRSVTDSIWL